LLKIKENGNNLDDYFVNNFIKQKVWVTNPDQRRELFI
jgi:hypothetical protein